MRLSQPPDIRSNLHVAFAALAVASIVIIGLVWHANNVTKTLGGPDDAMRLVLVRDLMSGGGWYDQLITRLQPMAGGTFLHWSRLLDGSLALITKAFALFLPPATAEVAMRLAWPLLLTLPAIWCALLIARRLGGSLAVFICAVLLASNQEAFVQFVPGSIDHHNVQIVMTLIAAACAMTVENRARWALLAGASTGLGLAIGIEALPFHLLIGASYALRAASGDDKRRVTRNYGFTVSGSTVLFYCLQTPPSRWAMSFCDAIGLNLVVAIVVISCGLIAISIDGNRLSTCRRLTILIAATAIAATAYLALDPACVRGPLAAVDPRIRPFWFNLVDEMQPLPMVLKHSWDMGVVLICLSALLIPATAFILTRDWPRYRPENVLASLLVAVAAVAGFEALRMESYVFWLGFPLLAAAFSPLAARFLGNLMVPITIVGVLLSPVGIDGLILAARAASANAHQALPPKPKLSCFETAKYLQLRMLPPGLVLADISMGPFILANTKDTVLAAPYHRMVWGILAAHDASIATSSKAEKVFRGLKIDYLVDCPANPIGPAPGSVESDIEHGRIPAWLHPLSGRNETLQIYRVHF